MECLVWTPVMCLAVDGLGHARVHLSQRACFGPPYVTRNSWHIGKSALVAILSCQEMLTHSINGISVFNYQTLKNVQVSLGINSKKMKNV